MVDENPADLKEYGLDAPRVEIEFKASGDKTYGDYHRLLIGGKSPTGGDVFAMRDADKRVILVPGHTDAIFNRSTFDLRDKTSGRSTGQTVDRIAASGNRRHDRAWQRRHRMEADETDDGHRGPYPRPTRCSASFRGRPMKSIVAEQATPADLKKYGFDRPQATLTLHAEGRRRIARLRWQRQRYRRLRARSSKPLVATADRSLLEALRKPAGGISPEEPLRVQPLLHRSARVHRATARRSCSRRSSPQDLTPDKWRRVSPNAGEPDAMNMDDLAHELEGLRATSFLNSTAGTGLDKPSLTVYAKFENGTKEDRVSFGRGGSGRRRVRDSPGQPGAAQVSAAEFDEAIKALDLISK